MYSCCVCIVKKFGVLWRMKPSFSLSFSLSLSLHLPCFRIEIENIARLPNTQQFTLKKEDNTLGMLFKHSLLQNEEVRFVGVKIPHPLVYDCIMTVQTMGNKTPSQVMQDMMMDLDGQMEQLVNDVTGSGDMQMEGL